MALIVFVREDDCFENKLTRPARIVVARSEIKGAVGQKALGVDAKAIR